MASEKALHNADAAAIQMEGPGLDVAVIDATDA